MDNVWPYFGLLTVRMPQAWEDPIPRLQGIAVKQLRAMKNYLPEFAILDKTIRLQNHCQSGSPRKTNNL